MKFNLKSGTFTQKVTFVRAAYDKDFINLLNYKNLDCCIQIIL